MTFPGRAYRTVICLTLLSLPVVPVAAQAPEEILVTGQRVASGSDADPELIKALDSVPGGTNLITPASKTQLTTLSDLFAYEPGVVVQEFFGGFDQPRLNIRGSGLQSNPVSRGVLLLQDYLPLNDADGSFIIGLIQPLATRTMTVQRGANSRVPGAVTLGGDVNMVSFSGAQPGGNIRLDAGNDERGSAHVNVGDSYGHLDYHLSVGGASYDGFRHHSQSKRSTLSANIGVAPTQSLSNRTYLSYNDTKFDMPFVLTSERAEQDPKSVMGDGDSVFDQVFNIYKRDPHRHYDTWRLANRTRFAGEHHQQTLGVYWQTTDDEFTDPLAHTISDIDTFGAQWLLDLDRGDLGNYQLGIDWSSSSMPREFYVNSAEDGSRGSQFGDMNLTADNTAISLVVDYPLNGSWTLNSQLQWITASRNSNSKMGPEQLDQDWQFLIPKLGFVYSDTPDLRLFINLSGSREVPTFWEIVQPDVPPLAPLPGMASLSLNKLDDQQAVTLEIGGKGRLGDTLGWDLSLYRSDIKDEILSVASTFGVIAESSNYDNKTVHQGVELGVYGQFPIGDDYVSFRGAWNYSDFYFANGVFDGNRIAGAPRNVVSGMINYHRGAFAIGASVYAQPDDNYVDHANTLKQDAFWLLGLTLNYQPTPWIRLYANVNNLGDQTYNASYVVRDRSTAAMPTFLPGNGRSFNGGLVLSW